MVSAKWSLVDHNLEFTLNPQEISELLPPKLPIRVWAR